jgi:hypothetical protein
MASCPLVRVMALPARLGAKLMVSPAALAARAARSEPAPLSAVLVTAMVAGASRSSRASSRGRARRGRRSKESSDIVVSSGLASRLVEGSQAIRQLDAKPEPGRAIFPARILLERGC